jgi:hypothetical protein
MHAHVCSGSEQQLCWHTSTLCLLVVSTTAITSYATRLTVHANMLALDAQTRVLTALHTLTCNEAIHYVCATIHAAALQY